MNSVYRRILKSLTTKYFHVNYPNGLTYIASRSFKTSQNILSEKKFNLDPSKIYKSDGTVIRKKTEQPKLITVVHDSGEKILTMAEALKLATHKGLYLVKIQNPAPKSMDFYKLSKAPELGSDSPDKKKSDMKKYVFKTTTAEHDLVNKARGLISALNKYNIGSYIIQSKSMAPEKTDELSSRIQKTIRDGGINFKIKEVRGTYFYKTFIVEKTEQDVLPHDNVERGRKNEKSDPPSEGITDKS